MSAFLYVYCMIFTICVRYLLYTPRVFSRYHNRKEGKTMEVFYTPKHARVGDAIPFYDGDRFRIFYLKNWNPYFGSDRTLGWHMLTTTDNLHYTETPTGILGGTGSVIRVGDTYHLFYCVFERNPQRQYICHAESPDLLHWTDIPEDKFGPDATIYQLTDWRDPFVFPSPDGNGWWMLTSAQGQGNTLRRGCVGLCKSQDLHHWECCEPFYAPEEYMAAYECPDLFCMNGWWYLIFSQSGNRFQTTYRMSRSLSGPWIRPDVDSFDGRAFYAAKTGSDGQKRYLYGWNPSRTQNSWKVNPNPDHEGYDCNTFDWGGSLVVHELVQRADGTLGVRPASSVLGCFPNRNRFLSIPLTGDWKTTETSACVESPNAYACLISRNQVPENGRLSFRFRFSPGTERLGVAVQVDEDFARGYYFYIDPKRQRLEFKSGIRMHEQGGWTFPFDVEIERPMELLPDTEYRADLIVDDSVMVLYVNDTALSTRVYDLRERRFGLIVSDGCASFTQIELQT